MHGGLNIHGVLFRFRRVISLTLKTLKVLKSWFANNNLPNNVLGTLVQAFSKPACQRN